MKRRVLSYGLLAAFLMLCITMPLCAQQKLNIVVKQPGTLAKGVELFGKYSIKKLSVMGKLNGSDLRLLRDMAGSDVHLKATKGRLTSLDLSKASFVKGGDCYLESGKMKKYTSNGTGIPEWLFKRCRLESFVFPEGCDTIGEQAFAYTGLKRVKLPENITISNYAFYGDSLLTSVTFPKCTQAIYCYAFNKCSQLKELTMNDVNYIAGQALQEMNELRNITIKGYLFHIDGSNTVKDCPKLQSIDFEGSIFSTGGPTFVADCAQLKQIVFHAPTLFVGFGEAEHCPQFKGYVSKGPVCSAGNDKLVQTVSDPKISKSELVNNLNKQLNDIAASKRNRNTLSEMMPWAYYNLACVCSLYGIKDLAVNALAKSIDYGNNNYYHIIKDSDLKNIHEEKGYKELIEKMQKTGDKLYVLKHSGEYKRTGQTEPRFSYEAPTDSALVAIRHYFNLDSIAGKGDEVTRIKHLLYWLHDLVQHDGSSSWPNCHYNAVALYQTAKKDKRGLNCRFMAEMLNDVLLAEGFKSRFLTCEPRDYRTDGDCHVIDVVWCRSLHKWIWVDPTFCAFVTDDKGLLLHPGEVRERLIKDLPLVLNDDANWNHQSKQTKEHYLEYYMAKNLYFMSCHQRSETESENPESLGGTKTKEITLIPVGSVYTRQTITTNDDAYFWQAPEGE
jgi:hypothetical protein